jgi:hypothetical protein
LFEEAFFNTKFRKKRVSSNVLSRDRKRDTLRPLTMVLTSPVIRRFWFCQKTHSKPLWRIKCTCGGILFA